MVDWRIVKYSSDGAFMIVRVLSPLQNLRCIQLRSKVPAIATKSCKIAANSGNAKS